MNGPWLKDFPPFLRQDICGLGFPSALQFIIPGAPAIIVCLSRVFSVNFAVKISDKNNQYHSSTSKRSVVY